ncbi:uncharacterized protein DS421_14g458260 [Arachis hypogaea]|nr:uncharacterized protein DS421_14g458260 [Arachis hypogaea]
MPIDSESTSESESKIEQAKDNVAKRRKRALETIREKRSKKRNDGAQSTNIAPYHFDSLEAQNEFSQTVPTVNLHSEQHLQTQGSSTPSVNAASNTRKNTPESPVKYFRKKKIFPRKTSKILPVATPNSELQIVEFRQETRSQPLEVHPLALSLPSSVHEELIRDDFIYVPPQNETQQTSNNDPAKEQEQQSKEPPVAQQSEKEAPVNVRPLEQQQQPCEEPTAQQSEQEAPVDVCPPEPKKQSVTGSLTSSVIEEFFKDDNVYEVSDKEQFQEPPVARQSEQETLILSSFDSAAQPRQKENERPSFSLGISPPASQPTQPSQESVSQLEILAEAVVDAGVTAALKLLKQQLQSQPYQLLNVEYTDKRTNKAYKFYIEQYAHHRQFLDKRKLASHPFLFVPLCNGGHWFNNFPDEGIRWGGTLNGGWTGRGSRVYPIEWSTYKNEIDDFRYQYGLNLLLHEINKIRDQVIWKSEAIRLSKPSAVLSSPYCKFTSGDLDSK